MLASNALAPLIGTMVVTSVSGMDGTTEDLYITPGGINTRNSSVS